MLLFELVKLIFACHNTFVQVEEDRFHNLRIEIVLLFNFLRARLTSIEGCKSLSSRTRFCQKKEAKEAIDVRDANRSSVLLSVLNTTIAFFSLSLSFSRSACLHLCLVVVFGDDDDGGDVGDFPPSSSLSLSFSAHMSREKARR